MFKSCLLNWVCERGVQCKRAVFSLCAYNFMKCACSRAQAGRANWKAVPFHMSLMQRSVLGSWPSSPPLLLLTSVCVEFTEKPRCCNTPLEGREGRIINFFFNCLPGYKLACIGLNFFFEQKHN